MSEKAVSSEVVQFEVVDKALMKENDLSTKTDGELFAMNARLQSLNDNIISSVKDAITNFAKIGENLCVIRDEKLYLLSGATSIYDFAENIYGFARTTTKNYIAVYEKFNGKIYGLVEKGYTFTKLVELLPVADDISSYKPTMKTKEIREKKVIDRLSDFEKDIVLKLRDVLPSRFVQLFQGIECVCSFVPDNKETRLGYYLMLTFADRQYISIKQKKYRLQDGSLTVESSFSYQIRICEDYQTPEDAYERIEKYAPKILEEMKKREEKIAKAKAEKEAAKEEAKRIALDPVAKMKAESAKAEIHPILLLKNEDAREEFVKDPNNWELVEKCSSLDYEFYRFKHNHKYMAYKYLRKDRVDENKTVWSGMCYYEKDYPFTSMNFTCITNWLKECKTSGKVK